ncbi:MAG: putative DNA-binding domain-containing protein [Pseudomonadota bacterium]
MKPTSDAGSNLPDFRSAQLDFCAHIRNPDRNPAPADIEHRRMAIYLGLFYRNIEGFLASAFPVAKSCLESELWHALVREFIDQHSSQSPYFLEISEEFLAFLGNRGLLNLPPFLLELCHYEWLELALDVAEVDPFPELSDLPPEIELEGHWRTSPVVQCAVYEWPVHRIGPEHQPELAPEAPSFLVVYRNREERVKFLEANPLTHRLLARLATPGEIDDVLQQLHAELTSTGMNIALESVMSQGQSILRKLIDLSIVLPVALSDG